MSAADRHLEQLLAPTVRALGFELWGLELNRGGNRPQLRVYIESEAGVGVDDCARVSHQISGVLDVEDPINGDYVLEVSSPGMDRPLYSLEQFRRYVGERVKLKLRLPFEGRRNFEGQLTGIEGEDVVLKVGDEDFLLPHEGIERARVVPVFDNKFDNK